MPLASDPRGAHVSIIDMLNSLNIHFTDIHALRNLFSITFYEKQDQDEISTMILKFSLLMLRSSWSWVGQDLGRRSRTTTCST